MFHYLRIIVFFKGNAQNSPLSVHSKLYNAVFDGIYWIEKPILINQKGIGILISEDDLNNNISNILDNEKSFIVVVDFEENKVYNDYDIIIMGLSPDTIDSLVNSDEFRPKEPEYIYITKKRGCELYKCKDPGLRCLIFLVQIDYLNMLLNPEIDSVNDVKPKRRKINTRYPKSEYIKVAIPIE